MALIWNLFHKMTAMRCEHWQLLLESMALRLLRYNAGVDREYGMI
jgi:hypothetical protein